MGKIDDLRRLREAAVSDAETSAAPARYPAGKNGASSSPATVVGEHGKCPECERTKLLANGVMASHQKGLGKMCPGSRRKPA